MIVAILILGIVLLVVIPTVRASSNVQRQLMKNEEKRRLETFEWSDNGKPCKTVIRVNFPEMTMQLNTWWENPEPGSNRHELSLIRRTANGSWESRLSEETMRARIEECEQSLSPARSWLLDLPMNVDTENGRKACMRRLDDARKNDWTELNEHLQSKIEYHYQRALADAKG